MVHVFVFVFEGHDGILVPLIFRYDGSLHDAVDLRSILNCIIVFFWVFERVRWNIAAPNI